jgi:RNA polymerase sigma-70 factor, ECF subfamily
MQEAYVPHCGARRQEKLHKRQKKRVDGCATDNREAYRNKNGTCHREYNERSYFGQINAMTTIDESNDFLWINETLQGKARSFSNIIIKYQDRIYTLVVRSIKNQEDAKDLTQNVFLNAFSGLKKFRKESSFLTWLYRIAINQVKNYWRNNKNRFVIAESELKPFVEEKWNRIQEISDANTAFESEELKQIVNDLISFLPMEQKQIFILYYIAGQSCQEIAEIYKTSPSNVKIQLFRGRQYLYNKFKGLFK